MKQHTDVAVASVQRTGVNLPCFALVPRAADDVLCIVSLVIRAILRQRPVPNRKRRHGVVIRQGGVFILQFLEMRMPPLQHCLYVLIRSADRMLPTLNLFLARVLNVHGNLAFHICARTVKLMHIQLILAEQPFVDSKKFFVCQIPMSDTDYRKAAV